GTTSGASSSPKTSRRSSGDAVSAARPHMTWLGSALFLAPRFALRSAPMPGCLFCNIVAGTTPAQIVHDNEHLVAFKDIRPIAPVHVLVIPKEHIPGIHDATPAHTATLGQLLLGARDVAEKLGL